MMRRSADTVLIVLGPRPARSFDPYASPDRARRADRETAFTEGSRRRLPVDQVSDPGKAA